MQIFTDICKQNKPCCAALGFFDGVHIGHTRLLLSMKEYAAENGFLSAVFTFSSSPAAALGKTAEIRSLMTLESKLAQLEAMDIDMCFAVDFMKYREVTAEDFVNDILLDTLNVRAAFCGYNYRFGKFAAGSCALLDDICKERGAKVYVTAPVCRKGDTVSSTRIRDLIELGKMHRANTLLGRPFFIEGRVLHGQQNGRTVGIPTVNQSIPEQFVKPRFGVYASFCVIDGKRFRAVTNIGTRPTVSGTNINCETHILDDINGDLYGKNVRTELLWFERDERKFPDLTALAKQISLDIEHINKMKIYESYKNGGISYGGRSIT